MIKNKIEAQEKKFIKVFDADPDIQMYVIQVEQ